MRLHGALTARAAIRSDWRFNREEVGLQSLPQQVPSSVHGCISRETLTLHICERTLQAWASRSKLLAMAVDAHRRGEYAAVAGASMAYYEQLSRPRDCSIHLHEIGIEAMLAGGATIICPAGTQPGVNCALHALGEYIGFSSAQSQVGSGVTVHPGADHVCAAETLLKVLSGDRDPNGQSIHLPHWRDLLPKLGFVEVSSAQPGDRVVYTGRAMRGRHDGAEVALHYGTVSHLETLDWPVQRSQGKQLMPSTDTSRVWIVSKLGVDDDLPTCLHPLEVLDPIYITLAESIGVHIFRPITPPMPLTGTGPAGSMIPIETTAALYRLACEFEQRVECYMQKVHGITSAGSSVLMDSGIRAHLKGSLVRFARG